MLHDTDPLVCSSVNALAWDHLFAWFSYDDGSARDPVIVITRLVEPFADLGVGIARHIGTSEFNSSDVLRFPD